MKMGRGERECKEIGNKSIFQKRANIMSGLSSVINNKYGVVVCQHIAIYFCCGCLIRVCCNYRLIGQEI